MDNTKNAYTGLKRALYEFYTATFPFSLSEVDVKILFFSGSLSILL
jgi:hypothetical protein